MALFPTDKEPFAPRLRRKPKRRRWQPLGAHSKWRPLEECVEVGCLYNHNMDVIQARNAFGRGARICAEIIQTAAGYS